MRSPLVFRRGEAQAYPTVDRAAGDTNNSSSAVAGGTPRGAPARPLD